MLMLLLHTGRAAEAPSGAVAFAVIAKNVPALERIVCGRSGLSRRIAHAGLVPHAARALASQACPVYGGRTAAGPDCPARAVAFDSRGHKLLRATRSAVLASSSTEPPSATWRAATGRGVQVTE